MESSKFCKFEKPLNAFYDKFTHFQFDKRVLIGMVFINCLIWGCLPTVPIIKGVILPRFVETVFVNPVQVAPKGHHCSLVSFNGSGKDMFSGVARIVTQSMSFEQFQFGNKVRRKFFGGFVKLFSPVSAYAVEVREIGRDASDRSTGDEGNDNLAHLLFAFALGYGLMAIVIYRVLKKRGRY